MQKTDAAIKKIIVKTLEDNKAIDIVALNIKKLTDIADHMIICTGNSTTHNKALVDKVLEKLAAERIKPLGVEGEDTREWCLIDLGTIIIHIMLQQTRDFYSLEKLWSVKPLARAQKAV